MSNCSFVQEINPELVDRLPVQLLFSLLYLAVLLLALTGNSIVLWVVCLSRVSLSVRSVFIGCLAVSDIVMSLTSLPITGVTIFSREWLFPGFLCKLIGVFQGGSIFVSSFTLTVIALDRCLLVLCPGKELITYERALNLVIVIWIVGYALALPVGLFSTDTEYPGICGKFCEETWPDMDGEYRSGYRFAYGLGVLVAQFVLPVVISSVCYVLISRVMRRQIEKRRGQQLLPEGEKRLQERKSKADRFSTVFACAHVTAMLSCAVNPLIYSWFNPSFRHAARQLVGWVAVVRNGQIVFGESTTGGNGNRSGSADARPPLMT